MFVASTEFSLGQSLLSPDDVIEIAEKYKLDTVVVADTMNVTSMIPLASKLGEKLVIGVRFTLVDEAVQERRPIYQPKVYPKDETGIQLIYKYLSKSYDRPYFYEQPRLDFTSFLAMVSESPSSFYVSTGDINSLFKYESFQEILNSLRSTLDAGSLIIDLCPVTTPLFDRLCHAGLLAIGEQDSVNVYIPAFYNKEDADIFPIHYSIHKNVEFNYLKPSHKEFFFDPANLRPMAEAMLERLQDRFGFTLHTRLKQAKFEQRYNWKPQPPRLPKLSDNPMETLRKLAIDGLKQRADKEVYGYKPTIEQIKSEYVPRLKYEFEVIEKLGFADYFLMVYELTDWCGKQSIKIGPGRGSVGGSLIAFCLNITDVDPLRFELMFERFINPTRIDLPDIDLDFMSTRRHEIVEHLIDRYGSDSVAGIINYASLGSRSALRSTCRILGMDDSEYACSKLIPSQFGFSAKLEEARDKVIDIKNFSLKYPDVWQKALKLEGKLRNYSTHAAGIIVSDRPIVKDAVIQISKGTRAANWDKKLCEKQGLIKLDVLGLTTLDIMDLCLSYIYSRHGHSIDLHSINLNDNSVLGAFSNGLTGGVFQFEGGSVKRLLKDLSKYTDLTFDDLVAANALNRPGPIEAGLVQMYVDGKNGDLHEIPHWSMNDILKPTFNVMVYQEQIMKVAVEYAGYTLPEADNLRKIMGKKLPEEMKKEAGKFVDGAVRTHGVARVEAEQIFDQISKFAFYAFNKSHSVEYSLLAYLCMWLKLNYPVEFYAASLTYVDDNKTRSIINEAKKLGITVQPPSINSSTDKFHPISEHIIVAPLSKIKYVNAVSSLIVTERDFGGRYTSIDDLIDRTTVRAKRKAVNKRVVEVMAVVGALDDIAPPSGPVCAVERSKALNEYLPSLPLGNVCIRRKMALKAGTGDDLIKILEPVQTALDKAWVGPFCGKDASFMVIFDAATATEAKNGAFTETKAFNNIRLAMHKAGLKREDAYWTGLVKRKKETKEKTFNNSVLEESFKILLREIEVLKPTVILALGSQVSRMFDPSLKGNPSDFHGKVLYRDDLDCNIVFSVNPSTIFFNPDNQLLLDEAFEIVADIL